MDTEKLRKKPENKSECASEEGGGAGNGSGKPQLRRRDLGTDSQQDSNTGDAKDQSTGVSDSDDELRTLSDMLVDDEALELFMELFERRICPEMASLKKGVSNKEDEAQLKSKLKGFLDSWYNPPQEL